MLIAGCGGSSSPGVAHLSAAQSPASTSAENGGSSPASNASQQQQMVAFAQCMRSHGVPAFPEPVDGRIALGGGPGSGLDPGSAQFRAAEKACRKLMPNGGEPSPQQRAQMQERALKFSACMRSHGVPNFPEPSFEGNGVRLTLKAGSGIDPRSPQFQAAQQACRSFFGPPGGKGAPGGPGHSSSGGPPGGPGGGQDAEATTAP
jgi:hypothetical protein